MLERPPDPLGDLADMLRDTDVPRTRLRCGTREMLERPPDPLGDLADMLRDTDVPRTRLRCGTREEVTLFRDRLTNQLGTDDPTSPRLGTELAAGPAKERAHRFNADNHRLQGGFTHRP